MIRLNKTPFDYKKASRDLDHKEGRRSLNLCSQMKEFECAHVIHPTQFQSLTHEQGEK